MSRHLPLALLAAVALAAPAVAQEPEPDLGGFDPIGAVDVPREQRGETLRGSVEVLVDGSAVVVRIVRRGRQIGRMAYDDVATGPLAAKVRMFKAGRDALKRRGKLKVRLQFSVDPPADPPQRASRRVTVRR